ncbi:MAG: kynureninase [Thermoleophilaceae bacterium]
MIDRAHAERLDAADPLASFRERFVIDDPDSIYLDGNSLGRLPIATRERLRALVDQWGSELVSAWHDWIDLPERAGDLLAAHVLGARPGEVLVADSTTVNLFKLASAVLDTREGAVVTDTGNFPTDRYVLDGVARRHGRELRLFEPDPLHGPLPDDVQQACSDGDVALVSLSQVAYRSGALADMEAIGAAAGAPVLWDVSHSAGAVPIELERRGIELAVGCTYKYLNAGPGAPAFLYVHEHLQPQLRTPIQGWFGQREQFRMERAYDPDPGIRGFLAGTPPILALAAVEEGARLIGEAGIAALREKAIALTELVVELHDAHLAPLGFELATPRDPARRGAHVCLAHPEAWPICRALIERAHVVPDFRGPDSIRLGVPPLYTRFTDVYDALERLSALIERGEHREVETGNLRVT